MGTKPPIEILNTLHKCAEIEGVLGKIYDLFADAYRENRDICRLFEKTAGEERNHEYQIRLAIKSLVPSIEAMTLTLEEADKHLTMAQETLDWLTKATPGIKEALNISITLEAKFSRFHMDTAARFADQSCAKLFTAMMAADEAHVAAMEKALAEVRRIDAALDRSK
ncbi:MAG: ferritin family protein [Geobacteraceae bacterium]|nr:ferritin family protein [Geobacteraceae bacterium]